MQNVTLFTSKYSLDSLVYLFLSGTAGAFLSYFVNLNFCEITNFFSLERLRSPAKTADKTMSYLKKIGALTTARYCKASLRFWSECIDLLDNFYYNAQLSDTSPEIYRIISLSETSGWWYLFLPIVFSKEFG